MRVNTEAVLRWMVVVLLAVDLSDGGGPLHHHFVKKLIGKKIFHKLRALDKCEVVWEEVSHPHCETTWEK